MRMLKNIYLGALVILLVMFTSAVSAADELVIYSARNEQLIKPLFDAYTAETARKSSSSPTRKVRCWSGSRPKRRIRRQTC